MRGKLHEINKCSHIFLFFGGYSLSGVAGPLPARGGGQICRPFGYRFRKLEIEQSISLNLVADRADDRYALVAVTLCFYCTQTHAKLTIGILHVNF